MSPILVRGMVGLGDNIYQRAIVREMAKTRDVYLETVWPQLYRDLPHIKCVRRETSLRTQKKNAERGDLNWSDHPGAIQSATIHYANRPGTMLQALCDSVQVVAEPMTFDLPAFPVVDVGRPYMLIRPATVRKEYRAESRNPLPEYLALAAERLRAHFHIISVADLVDRVEWPLLPLPYADETFHAGECRVEELLALVAGAAGVVGGVGWLVPAALAYRVPMLLIFGGMGISNGPDRIFDSRIDTTAIRQVIPPRFCRCSNPVHQCDKRIPDIAEQIDRWVMGLAASRQAGMAA